MATVVRNTIKYRHSFDPATKRHQINGVESVLHCHHYSALYTQLAIDAEETKLLKECARDAMRNVLDGYYADNPDIASIQGKIEIACQYYGLVGLGKMVVDFCGEYSGQVTVLASHTDDGWMKKWGQYDRPVNYITAGFIEAMFESVLDKPAGSFTAVEVQSIVMGAETSVFKVSRG